MPTRYNSRGHAHDARARRRAPRDRVPRARRSRSCALAFETVLPGHERPRRREPAGAHPRRAADDALQPARLARADDREQVGDGGRLLDALRRHRGRLRADQGRARRRSSSRSPATSTRRPGASGSPPRSSTARPSAELRDEQRDDQSLPPYEDARPAARGLRRGRPLAGGDRRRGIATLELAQRIARLVDLAEYKRRQAPPGIQLHAKAFGRDRRLPITNRYGR